MRKSFRNLMLKLDRLRELTVSTTNFLVNLLIVTALISCQNNINRHAKVTERISAQKTCNHPFVNNGKNNGVFMM
jgi:hypothetical protein